MAKQKFYVVWEGVIPGIYTSWTDCQLQIKGYEAAKYKSFDTREEAERALTMSPYAYIGKNAKSKAGGSKPSSDALPSCVIDNSLAVDAACSGNPGPMEYRGVHIASRQEIFHFGPMKGTNNIGEFLAIEQRFRHAYLQRQRQCDQLGTTEEVQNQAPPHSGDGRTVFIDRTGRKMVAGKYIYHSYPEMGNERMGRNSGRLRQKIKEHKFQS